MFSELADKLVVVTAERNALLAQRDALAAERDAHLETIRETFRVLESRGQAPDDNAPLEVTVRRVLDYLDRVTAERDALRKRFKDAPRRRFRADSIEAPQRMAMFALVRLEDGE